jgi:NADH-quinone oxidoreductase subunit M
MKSSLLLFAVLQPVAGAIVVWLWPGDARRGARVVALASTLLNLAAGIAIALAFSPAEAGPQLVTRAAWLPQIGIEFHLGVDGISLWLIVLTTLLSTTAVLVSWEAITQSFRAYYALLLLLETGMLGVFASLDVILFYVFFEFTLIPLFFLIGIWGGPERKLAARKFFIYTLTGSVLTLLGLVYVVVVFHGQAAAASLPVSVFSIPDITKYVSLTTQQQWWIFLALAAGFAVKVPLFPFHTWLPLAHVEAPTAGSVILAGVLLKMGTYGFLRFSLALLPVASHQFLGWIAVLSVIGIIYGALVALAQDDIKKLVAYSSVSHLGYCMLGLFALNTVGISGSVLQMVNHGLSTGALFALVGILYERYHTRDIRAIGGIARQMPVLAFFFIVISLSSIGLPGLNGFVGEILILAGMFQVNAAYAAWAAVGIVLGAFYMLWLVQRIFFGPLREPAHEGGHAQDMNPREIAAIAPIAVACLWIGLFPNFFLSRLTPAVQEVVQRLNAAGQPTVANTAGGVELDGRRASFRSEAAID